MLSAFVDYLLQQGYQYVDRYDRHVFAKTFENGRQLQTYVVCLYTGSEIATSGDSKIHEKQNKIRNMFVQNGLPGQYSFLNLVFIKDGVTEYFKELCNKVDGIWFISEQEKRLYIYENQSSEFGDLTKIISEFLSQDIAKQYQKEQTGQFLKNFQPVTMLFVAFNLIAFLVSAWKADVNNAQDMYNMGAMTSDSVLFNHQYWRLVTSMFLHFGLSHLVNNMISLSFLGSMLEKRMGHLKFAILYLGSGIAGNIISAKVEFIQSIRNPQAAITVSAGASGAIFGVIGALICIVIVQSIGSRKKHVYEEISLSGLLWMALFSLLAGFTTAGVDNAAHVGGMISGFLIAALYVIQRSCSQRFKETTKKTE